MNFALIGAAGFVAPRHMRAIKDTGHQLLAAYDPNDSVGVIDSHFPQADFFTEFERFDRHLEKLKRSGQHIDYVVVCSPNYLHDAHIRFGLRLGADVICERPLVFTIRELEELKLLEKKFGKKVNVILQLRLHEKVAELKSRAPQAGTQKIELRYVAARGPWYFESWKGDLSKAGGLSTNIALDSFDMLTWIWGPMIELNVEAKTPHKEQGTLKLQNAAVQWMVSIAFDDVPADLRARGQLSFRSICVDGTDLELSEESTELHNLSYEKILNGQGFSLDDVRDATKITESIRGQKK